MACECSGLEPLLRVKAPYSCREIPRRGQEEPGVTRPFNVQYFIRMASMNMMFDERRKFEYSLRICVWRTGRMPYFDEAAGTYGKIPATWRKRKSANFVFERQMMKNKPSLKA